MRRTRLEIAVQQFEQIAKRIQIENSDTGTTAYGIRIDRGLLSVRVFVNGELREVIDLPTRDEYPTMSYGNRV